MVSDFAEIVSNPSIHSEDGRPILEIQKNSGKDYKIRYQ